MPAYFYDSQVKKFLLQFMRIFSEWNVTFGTDPAGNTIYHRVPITYGDSSRQASTIIANNSASNIPSAPQITCYISGLDYDQTRTQDPTFVDVMNVRQRAYNQETGEYDAVQGNAFTVERLMPVPYTLRITVDFWTTNYQQKLELIEQMAVLFNPSLEIQSTDNFLDWTSLSVVYQDGITFTSRSIPIGNGNPIDVMSWRFYMPIWISAAVKVKKLGIIQKIIASIHSGKALSDIQDDDLLLGTRQKITPYGYQLLLLGNNLRILPANNPNQPPNTSYEVPTEQSENIFWRTVLNVYGVIRPGVSMIALENPYLSTEIMGTIEYNQFDDNILIFNIDPDTLPQNTLYPVDSIIDPTQKYPGDGLPPPISGQRYLIVTDIPHQITYNSLPNVWHGLITGANAGSIIEYNETEWFISFDTGQIQDMQFVTNLTSEVQYRYISDQGWTKSYEGYYNQGDWRIVV